MPPRPRCCSFCRRRSSSLVRPRPQSASHTAGAGSYLHLAGGHLSAGDPRQPNDAVDFAGGAVLGIASAFAAAFYTTYPSTLIARYGTLPIVGWSMLFGGAMLLPFYGGGTDFVVNGSLLLAFSTVVIGTSLTFSLYLNGAQKIGGARPGSKLRRTAEQRPAVAPAAGDHLHAAGLAGHSADPRVGGADRHRLAAAVRAA